MEKENRSSTTESSVPRSQSTSTSIEESEQVEHMVDLGINYLALFKDQKQEHDREKKRWAKAFKTSKDEFDKQNKAKESAILELEKKIESLDNKIQNSTSNSFANLSIFATVFVFLSLNISIFQETTSASTAVFFMFIIALACCIIISVPLLVMFSFNGHEFKNRQFILWVFGVATAFLLVTWVVTFFSNVELKFKASLPKVNEVKVENDKRSYLRQVEPIEAEGGAVLNVNSDEGRNEIAPYPNP